MILVFSCRLLFYVFGGMEVGGGGMWIRFVCFGDICNNYAAAQNCVGEVCM